MEWKNVPVFYPNGLLSTEGFPTTNVAVSGEFAIFFTRTDLICKRKKWALLVKNN